MSREKRRTRTVPTGGNLHLSTCDRCDKASYADRVEARKAARVLHPGRRLHAFPCPFTVGLWHLRAAA